MPDYTILLVEYEPRVIEAVRNVLEGAGYHVEIARNGNEGIAAFDRLKPDLSLIAAMLPRRHGLEVCRELKATDRGRKSPVLVLASRFQGRRIVGQARRNGAAGCVFKPINEHELLASVRDHLPPARTVAAEAEPAAVTTAEPRIAERLGRAPSEAPAYAPRATPDREPTA
jgi:DNA-binding response OmpR family regulator